MQKRERIEIRWVKKDDVSMTSLLIWNEKYFPYQAIIFRKELLIDNHIVFQSYIRINDSIYSNNFVLPEMRINDDAEILFYTTSFTQSIINKLTKPDKFQDPSNKEKDCQENDEDLLNMLDELFMSAYAMQLMLEHSPDFGFYSLSPNFNKLEAYAKGEKFGLFDEIIRLKEKYSNK